MQWPERSCDRVTRCRFVRHVPSALIGGGRLCNTLLFVMFSIAVLTNEVCIVCSESFLVLASNSNTVWVCLLRVSPSFPSVDDPSWACGDKHYLCLDSVQRENSGGPQPVASWSRCEGDPSFYVSV